jgi:nucleotide-binding universal stress UspA family protein
MKRILVVMTTSGASRIAFEEALALATRTGARVRLARVLGMCRPSAVLGRAEDWLERLESNVPEGRRDGVVALFGPAPLAIRRAAEAYAADVVVFGAPTYAALVRAGLDATFIDRIGPKIFIVHPMREDSAPISGESHRGHGDHVMVEAATMAGATTGALIAGVVAGPPGALAGAAIGGTIGLLAGRALEKAEDSAERHDHELDDAIGVTRGPIGLGGVLPREEAIPVESSLTLAGRVLAEDHQELDRLYAALVAACDEGDWCEVQAEWKRFEARLRSHMATEEHVVFPALVETQPSEVKALITEHEELRRHLDELAMSTELHTISPGEMKSLVDRVQAHGRREERILYPWVDRAIAAAA